MTVRTRLTDEQWAKIADVIHAGPRGRGRPALDDRNFVEAVLWFHRAGAPWRDLPSEFGPWKTVFNRFDRWSKRGRWKGLFEALKTDIDGEWHSIDSTINRAHQHAAGAKGGLSSMRSAAPEAADLPRCT
jgi:transposase